VIPDFGYSTERIGIHVPLEHAGNPSLVRLSSQTIQ
jgi:hypothetical protein